MFFSVSNITLNTSSFSFELFINSLNPKISIKATILFSYFGIVSFKKHPSFQYKRAVFISTVTPYLKPRDIGTYTKQKGFSKWHCPGTPAAHFTFRNVEDFNDSAAKRLPNIKVILF